MIRNYGLILREPQEPDYVSGKLGASLPTEILQPDGDWSDYLPIKEYQNLNNIEPYACVAFTILNCVEILIRRQYNEERNYSDRFLAAISGTKEGGNDPHTVAEFLRKIGVVPQEVWPFDSTITSFQEFYKPLPPKLYELAEDFKKEWDFKHEYVPSDHQAISDMLKCSPLLISVSAWFLRGSRYYRPEKMQDNHATTMFYERFGDFRRVFDSYADGEGDPAIKDVEWEAVPMMVKRFWIKKRAEVDEIKKSLALEWLKLLFAWLGLFKAKNEALQAPTGPAKPPVSVVVPVNPVLEPKYKWGTKTEARHSVRLICDEEKLSWGEKNLITAVIQCESDFNIKAEHKNRNGTIDYGIIQANSYWYIGEGKPIPSVEVALNDPAFCVRVMIQQFKAGKLKDWICYRTSAYRKFLI